MFDDFDIQCEFDDFDIQYEEEYFREWEFLEWCNAMEEMYGEED